MFIFATFIFLGLATAIFSASFAVGFFGEFEVCRALLYLFRSVLLPSLASTSLAPPPRPACKCAHAASHPTGFWLACTLIFFLFLSFNLTVSSLATYLLVRFVVRARQEGSRAALTALADDARAQFRGRGRKPRASGLQGQDDGPGVKREGSDPDSVVIVDSASTSGAQRAEFGEKVPGVPVDAPA